MPKPIVFLSLFLFTMPALTAGSFSSQNSHIRIRNFHNIFLRHFVGSPVIALSQSYYDLLDLSEYSIDQRFVSVFQTIFKTMNKPSAPFRVRVATNDATSPYYEFYVDSFDIALRIDFFVNELLYHALIVDNKLYLSVINHEWQQEKTTLTNSGLPWDDIFPARNFPQWNSDQLRYSQRKPTTTPLPVSSRAISR